ncbi:MAG: flagellar hook-basal body complex protein, partial [Acidobacteria bacterium]|nr:flagellar hook-basal body complex protein [Acidobacteriota bacterium]
MGLDLADKQYAAALQRVGKELEKNPKQAELRFLQAKVFLAQRDMPQAEAALRKAVELQPDFHAAYFLLAQLYVNSNQRQKAMEELFAVVAKNPKDIGSLMLIGMIYDNEKNYNAARDAYEKLLAVNPKFGPALNNLAYLYSEQLGRLDRAYELASKARELQPKDPFTADTLGWILYKKDQYLTALNLLRETSDKLPTEPEVQFHLAMAHYMIGEEDLARLAFQRALQLNKDFPGRIETGQCLSVLAVDAKTAGAEARAGLEKRIAEKPNDPVALLRLAAIYAREGAFDKAVATYQTISQANPRNVKALISVAQLYAGRSQDTLKAFEYAKAAYKVAPDDLVVSSVLGRLAYRTGDYKWALSLLRQSAARQSGDPELLYDLAEAAYSVGRIAEAEMAAQNALRVGVSFTRADEARRFLGMVTLVANPSQALAAESQVEQILKSDPVYVPALMVVAAINEQRISRQMVTNELANVSTVGFKRSFEASVRAVQVNGPGLSTRMQPQSFTEDFIQLKAGTVMATGNNLDVALTGSAVLGVTSPDGQLAFTRRGDLRVNGKGVLENGSGYLVRGKDNSPISAPAGLVITIESDGTVFGRDPAQTNAKPPVALGTLLMRDASEVKLQRRPDGLYSVVGLEQGADFPSGPKSPRLTSGALEGSNVNAL